MGVSGQASRGQGSRQRLRLLASFSPPRLVRERGRNVVVEDIVVAALLVGGVRPPVCEELARCRDHSRDEHEELGGDAGTDERSGEAPERVAHDDEVTAIADCLDDRVGVLRPAGRDVLAGKIDGDRVVPLLAQLGATRCQSHDVPPPPWMSANVATAGEATVLQSSTTVRSSWRSRSGSVRKSSSTILPFRTVTAPTENGRPWRKATIPATPLISAGRMSSPSWA